MLGKRSCILRTTSSRSLLIPGDDSDGESPTFCNFAEVAEKGPGPALSSPRKIVIGFDMGAEKKPLVDVCESPRSVLDSSAALSTQGKQKMVARSPRSGLGSLLAGKSGSDEIIGLGVHPSDGGMNVPSLPVADRGQGNNQCSIKNPGLPLVQTPSKATAWPNKVSKFDGVDGVISAHQGQGLQADMADEILDADISPIRVGGTCMYLTEEMKLAHEDSTMSVALDHTPGNSINCSFIAADSSTKNKTVDASVNKNAGISAIVSNAVYNKGLIPAPGYAQATHSLLLWQGGCDNSYAIPCQEQCWHCTSLDVEKVGIHQSIFSASSPPPCPRSVLRASPGFLKICNFCGRSLQLGKDIFMYRGDQPFCSAECRYQKIAIDERKDRRGS